jgi:hypothetical protein
VNTTGLSHAGSSYAEMLRIVLYWVDWRSMWTIRITMNLLCLHNPSSMTISNQTAYYFKKNCHTAFSYTLNLFSFWFTHLVIWFI